MEENGQASQLLPSGFRTNVGQPLSDIGFLDEITFTDGGSGRFTTASGYGIESGAVNLDTGEFTVVMEGFINYSRQRTPEPLDG